MSRYAIPAFTFEHDPARGPIIRAFADEDEPHEVATATREGVAWNTDVSGVIISRISQWHEDMVRNPDEDFSEHATHTQAHRGVSPQRRLFPADQRPLTWRLRPEQGGPDVAVHAEHGREQNG